MPRYLPGKSCPYDNLGHGLATAVTPLGLCTRGQLQIQSGLSGPRCKTVKPIVSLTRSSHYSVLVGEWFGTPGGSALTNGEREYPSRHPIRE